MNFLEQLATEWYGYEGYYVRSNVKARKRPKGGWDAELDVMAYDPARLTLLHVETSGAADSWGERKRRFLTKKFIFPKEEYEFILGSKVSQVIKIAIVGYSRSTTADLNWGEDIKVILVPDFVRQIVEKLRSQHPTREAIPEGYPLLRTVQMVIAYGL